MTTIHASAVLVGARAMLIRGPSGAGKSRLALALLDAAASGRLAFARLVADDRVHLEAVNGRLLARSPGAIAGLLEVRGLGIRRLPYEPVAVLGWVVDLGENTERIPSPEARERIISGVTLPRFAFPPCIDPLAVLLAALRFAAAPGEPESGADVAAQH